MIKSTIIHLSSNRECTTGYLLRYNDKKINSEELLTVIKDDRRKKNE